MRGCDLARTWFQALYSKSEIKGNERRDLKADFANEMHVYITNHLQSSLLLIIKNIQQKVFFFISGSPEPSIQLQTLARYATLLRDI